MMKMPTNYPTPWRIEYDTYVGYASEHDFDWCNIRDALGNITFRTDDEKLAKWLVEEANKGEG